MKCICDEHVFCAWAHVTVEKQNRKPYFVIRAWGQTFPIASFVGPIYMKAARVAARYCVRGDCRHVQVRWTRKGSEISDLCWTEPLEEVDWLEEAMSE